MTRPKGPFVLIDDARPGGTARLFSDPARIVTTRYPEDVRACCDSLRNIESGLWAGFLGYEAGYSLEDRLTPLRRSAEDGATPLVWFGLFNESEPVDPAAFLPDPRGAWAGRPRPLVERHVYEQALARVKAHIEAGDIYQANLTFQAEIATAGDPMALYAGLRRRAKAGHGALVFTGEHWILSLSPELFFTLAEGEVTTRPMKGTAPAGSNPEHLRVDPKQRAENLMIVDLLRNDLSRVARPGSVKVPELFAVEHYPTVLQMTSTVTADLEESVGPVELVEAIFPCGSITGAPKIRAMEIISRLETAPRGVYCGAIGFIQADGSAAFNVAIRTLTLKERETTARLGLGSGIVADSEAGDEWRECLAKGRFVATERSFDLIETMGFDPHDGIVDLDSHLTRMKASAQAFGFPFDRHDARNELQAATFRAGPSKVRLLLSRSGAMAIELRPMEPPPIEPIDVAIAPLPVSPTDFRLAHKTTDRGFYDEARMAAGTWEVLFEDKEGFLTEGSFSNIFVERQGRLLTPPLSRGVLPGLLRQRLIDEGKAREADLKQDDLTGGFLLGNSYRGLLEARLLRSPA